MKKGTGKQENMESLERSKNGNWKLGKRGTVKGEGEGGRRRNWIKEEREKRVSNKERYW
jgi:hypothetical protein